jgi:hypothetical protein
MSRVSMDEKSLTREIEGLRHERDRLRFLVQRFLSNHDCLSMNQDNQIVDRWPTLAQNAREVLLSIDNGKCI